MEIQGHSDVDWSVIVVFVISCQRGFVKLNAWFCRAALM